MHARFVSSLLIAATLCACARTSPPAPRDDLVVLKAVLENACKDPSAAPGIISDSPAEFRNYDVPDEWPRAREYERALEAHSTRATTWPIGPMCENSRIVAQADIRATFANDPRIPAGWEKFEATFQGARGYSGYSHPIYSADGRHALVLSDWRCEGLCGMGMMIELEWVNGRWRAIRFAGTWMS